MSTQVPRGLVIKQLIHVISSQTQYFGSASRTTTVYKSQPVILLRPVSEAKKEVVIRCRECQKEMKIEIKSRKEFLLKRLKIGLGALVLSAITYGLFHLDNALSPVGLVTGLGALCCIVWMFKEKGVFTRYLESHTLEDVSRKWKKSFKKTLASGAASTNRPQQPGRNTMAG